MRSPILGAAATVADLGVNVAAAYQAARMDRRYALGFSTTIAWLAFGSALAGYIALRNDDPRFGVHRDGNILRERERIDSEMFRQSELAERGTVERYHGEDKVVADTFPASDPPQAP